MISINSTTSLKSLSKPEWIGLICALATLAFPFVVMLMDSHVEHSQSLCPFKMLTGFPCPGCGITKSIIYFYQGDIISSLGQHVFGIGVALAAVYYLIWLAFKFLTGVSVLPAILKNRALGYGLGAFLGIYHLGRLVVFIMQHSIGQILRESVWM